MLCGLCPLIYLCLFIKYIYIYIYIERERERENRFFRGGIFSLVELPLKWVMVEGLSFGQIDGV